MKIIKKGLRVLKKMFHYSFLQTTHPKYIKRISNMAPWIYISYISEVYYAQNNHSYLNSHQNKREALAMAPILNNLGFNVYIQSIFSEKKLPNITPKIVFGLEPLFEKACKKWPDAIKIYYATGAYYEHQNTQIIQETDAFNSKYHCNIEYNRLVTPHKSCEISDYILQIGSNYTISTYPPSLRSKIKLIHQSSIPITFTNTQYSIENEYFFIASGGNILKGIHLLIEYFSIHTSLTINILCPIEDAFFNAIHEKITPNIHFYGYLELNSPTMREIVSKSNFIIYTSGSEGGVPGAVINSMKMGLIPIVTQWSAFDEINDYGYLIHDWSIEGVDKGIKWSEQQSPETIKKLKKRCSQFANNKYNIDNFTSEFKEYFSQFSYFN